MKHRVHMIVVLSLLAALFLVVSSVGAAPANRCRMLFTVNPAPKPSPSATLNRR